MTAFDSTPQPERKETPEAPSLNTSLTPPQTPAPLRIPHAANADTATNQPKPAAAPAVNPNETAAEEQKAHWIVRLGRDLATRLRRLPGQLLMRDPFSGTMKVDRLPVMKSIATTVRHIGNPIKIIDRAFEKGGDLSYLNIPGFGPILYVRDPEVIKEVLAQTGQDKSFERDGLQTQGIGRIVGDENLLRAQGSVWKTHKQALARPLDMRVVGAPEVYRDMERISRTQLGWLESKVKEAGRKLTSELKTPIDTAMLELLSKTMFGIERPSESYRDRYLPAIENVIDYILIDTVTNVLGVSRLKFPAFTKRRQELKASNAVFEELVGLAIEQRAAGGGFWNHLRIQGTDAGIKSNVKVLTAGALEATASYVAWTICGLARNPEAQEKVRREALSVGGINAAGRNASTYLQQCLDESLRWRAPLYLLPRFSKKPVTVTTSKGTLEIPEGVHIILATYHAGRHEKYWGVEKTGYPAKDYEPDRWSQENMAKYGMTEVDNMHFGFGHGARFCSGRNFARVEAFVALNLFFSKFKVTAVNPEVEAVAGVSTKPGDRVLVNIELVE